MMFSFFFGTTTMSQQPFVIVGTIWSVIGMFVAMTAGPLPKDPANRHITQTMIWACWPLYLAGRGFHKLYKRAKQFVKNRRRQPQS